MSGRKSNSCAETYSSALLCALAKGRTAISMGGKTGDGERNGDEVHFPVAHCQWGKKRVC